MVTDERTCCWNKKNDASNAALVHIRREVLKDSLSTVLLARPEFFVELRMSAVWLHFRVCMPFSVVNTT